MSELAFSFGRIAAEYDDVRPEYAPEALRSRRGGARPHGRLARASISPPAPEKLTRALAPRFAEVVAVEPNDEMRAVLAGRSAGRARAGRDAQSGCRCRTNAADARLRGRRVPLVRRRCRRRRARCASCGPAGGVALLWNRSVGRRRRRGRAIRLEPPLPAAARAMFDDVYVKSGRRSWRGPRRPIHVEIFAGWPFGEPLTRLFERRGSCRATEVIDLYSHDRARSPRSRRRARRAEAEAALALLDAQLPAPDHDRALLGPPCLTWS